MAENLLTSASADVVLNALPHPVIVVSSDGKVSDANAAAEAFFEVSVTHLRRHLLRDLVPFGSPLLTLVEQVRARGAPVNEYKVDLGTPRNPGDRLVDLSLIGSKRACRRGRQLSRRSTCSATCSSASAATMSSSPTTPALIEGAIKGMLGALDPHSSYMDAEELPGHAGRDHAASSAASASR